MAELWKQRGDELDFSWASPRGGNGPRKPGGQRGDRKAVGNPRRWEEPREVLLLEVLALMETLFFAPNG